MSAKLINEPEAGTFTAFWSKSEWEGGCQNCHRKPERIAVIVTAFKLRFCADCLGSLGEITQSLLDEYDEGDAE